MVHMAEFHFGRTHRLGTEERLSELKVMHDEFSRLSDEEFLLIERNQTSILEAIG